MGVRGQEAAADDYVAGTGETHWERELCDLGFSHVGLNYQEHVIQDQRFFRPAEVDLLVGDASKAGRVLGWEPSMTFRELIQNMVDADLDALKNGREA